MTEQHDRKPVLWCARCRRPDHSLVYMSDGAHYCWDCADHMHRNKGLAAAGKRDYDLNPFS